MSDHSLSVGCESLLSHALLELICDQKPRNSPDFFIKSDLVLPVVPLFEVRGAFRFAAEEVLRRSSGMGTAARRLMMRARVSSSTSSQMIEAKLWH